jgi:hypothetical protein
MISRDDAVPANCPHKLTKTAEPWLGGEAALGGFELHAGVTSAAVRSRHCMLVAAAAAPPKGGRHGGRCLQLRVITLGGECLQSCQGIAELSLLPRFPASSQRFQFQSLTGVRRNS